MKKLMAGVVVLLVVVGLAVGVATGVFGTGGQSEAAQPPAEEKKDVAAESPKPAAAANKKPAMAFIEQAAQDKKYLFCLFSQSENAQTASMKKVVEAAVAKASDRATAAFVQVTDPAEREVVKKFGLDRAPMPLTLVIAPNGAIMGGLTRECTEEELLGSFGTPVTEKCMKSLQDGKLVFVCVQNDSTKSNTEALQGVQDFKAEAQYAGVTEIVKLNPADAAEASFLKDLKIDPKTTVAMTAFLAPPGAVIAEFEGATQKEQLVAALQKARSACGPGGSCGPGGCGPR